jgi:hypothetical protein
MDELRKVFGQITMNDLDKSDFDRGVLYGQERVIKKILSWKEVSNGRQGQQWTVSTADDGDAKNPSA